MRPSDAPAVDIDLNGMPFGRGLDFKQAVPNQSVAAGSAELVVRGILPGTARPDGDRAGTRDARGRAPLRGAGGESRHGDRATRDCARRRPPVPAGSTRLQVVHAAPAAPRVAVYVTAPNASLAASAPAGTVSFKESFGPAVVTAGDIPDPRDAGGHAGHGGVRFGPGASGGRRRPAAWRRCRTPTTGAAPITLLATSAAGGRDRVARPGRAGAVAGRACRAGCAGRRRRGQRQLRTAAGAGAGIPVRDAVRRGGRRHLQREGDAGRQSAAWS